MRADDRVLVLPIPAAETLIAMARILMRGVLVGVGQREEVDRAREALAEFDNVMLIEAEESRIPWRDAYFTKVIAGKGLSLALEADCRRVLAPNGEFARSGD